MKPEIVMLLRKCEVELRIAKEELISAQNKVDDAETSLEALNKLLEVSNGEK